MENAYCQIGLTVAKAGKTVKNYGAFSNNQVSDLSQRPSVAPTGLSCATITTQGFAASCYTLRWYMPAFQASGQNLRQRLAPSNLEFGNHLELLSSDSNEF